MFLFLTFFLSLFPALFFPTSDQHVESGRFSALQNANHLRFLTEKTTQQKER